MGPGWVAECHQRIDRFCFLTGSFVSASEPLAFSIRQDVDFLPDVLPNSLRIPLVSRRVKQEIERESPFSVQFIPVRLEATDGSVVYHLMNVLSRRRLEELHRTNRFRVIGRKRAYFLTERHLSGSLGSQHVMRDDRTLRLYVSQRLAGVLERSRITGIRFTEVERLEGTP
ncbi:imm11 family protein [Exiguobacterium flavidum]|uniref:imm11 family protein n=1 Tax=Exiguobacterium flavidum TaxID=2184695 RepID=UPI000DF73501|nr:hypothetical protein [Exiguobacterium flavidum]